MARRVHLVALTGAGISAESGIKTFRDSDGLWEGFQVEEVATPDGWSRDPGLVLDFYNARREDIRRAKPNLGHIALAEAERLYDITVITQNIDDLHERAGSSQIVHLHGEILKARSSVDERLIYELGEKNIELGDRCERGSQLRPHVVWFYESVPEIQRAIEITKTADVMLIVGSSLVVYPAADLVTYAPRSCPVYVVDPNAPKLGNRAGVHYIEEPASSGVSRALAQIATALLSTTA